MLELLKEHFYWPDYYTDVKTGANPVSVVRLEKLLLPQDKPPWTLLLLATQCR